MLFLLLQGCLFQKEYTISSSPDDTVPDPNPIDYKLMYNTINTSLNSNIVNTQASQTVQFYYIPSQTNSNSNTGTYRTSSDAITILEPSWIKYLRNSQGNQQECTQDACMEQTYTPQEVKRYKEIDCMTTGKMDGWVAEEQINLLAYGDSYFQKGKYTEGKCIPIKPKEAEPKSTQRADDEELIDLFEERVNAIINMICTDVSNREECTSDLMNDRTQIYIKVD